MTQMALPLQLADHAVFASFHAAGNEALTATLRDIAQRHNHHGCWLWGARASGKTHLLQAVCEAAGDRSMYLPMKVVAAAGPGILDGLEGRDVVCIDDVNLVVGSEPWETALFSLCNQMFDAGGQLLFSAPSSPREAGVHLADLASRLMRLPVFQVQSLSEEQSVTALQLRSRHRGLELPDESARYLMRRSRRDMASLYEMLDRLDHEALRAKRRLTVPFVRAVLESQSD